MNGSPLGGERLVCFHQPRQHASLCGAPHERREVNGSGGWEVNGSGLGGERLSGWVGGLYVRGPAQCTCPQPARRSLLHVRKGSSLAAGPPY